MRFRRWRAVAVGMAVLGACVTGAGPSGGSTPQPTPPAGVQAFGDAAALGAPGAHVLNSPLSGVATTRDSGGYWLLGADGGVFTYGDAHFFGSAAGSGVRTPFVGIAPTLDGQGYWLAGTAGDVLAFGDAPNGESFVNLTAPAVAITADHAAHGYWLTSADGGVYSVGDAVFHGSAGGERLNAPIVGMAATPDGGGYWLAAADGGVFSFGDAVFHGSAGGERLNAPIVGMAATPDGGGYWLAAADGGVFSFGDAVFHGSAGEQPANAATPAVAIAATTDGGGYWMATTDKPLPPPAPVPAVLAACNDPTIGPSVRPTTIVLACGDGNASLTHLVWSSWTPATAAARGDYKHNLCSPDCAHGSFVSTPATVRLGYPVETDAGEEFGMLSYTTGPSQYGPAGTFTEAAPTSPG